MTTGQPAPAGTDLGDLAAAADLRPGESVCVLGRGAGLHGEPLPAITGPLEAAGARVTELLPYRWQPPADSTPVRTLVAEAAAGRLDAVTFTSAPAVHGVLRVCTPAAVVEAFERTLVACVGSVTGRPLAEHGIGFVTPERPRTGALLRLVSERLS